MSVSRLRVSNEAFLVASMIERCPKVMMLRELVQNAIEATVAGGGGVIDILPVSIGGVRKLAIRNGGRGMAASELHRMCDLASSIGKENALDGNFGMGAKVACLPSNRHGLRYRSCRRGRVHQVIMGKRDGVYGRLFQPGAAGGIVEVRDVSDEIADAGELARDWTEVVLLGNDAAQDTVADPYGGAPAMARNWIADGLYMRFFRLPPGVTIRLHEGCHPNSGARDFAPIGARFGAFSAAESVPVGQGVVLHFLYDAPDADEPARLASARGALQSPRSGAALVHRNEIYDLRLGGNWAHEAPLFGIPFGSRLVSVYVELPDGHELTADAYRQFLRHAADLQRTVTVREFAARVMLGRPDWLVALLHDLMPHAAHGARLQEEMAGLFRALGVRRRWWPPAAPGGAAAPAAGAASEPAEEALQYEVAPQIVPVTDPAEIAAHGLQRMAARFHAEAHQLFFNPTCRAVMALADLLEQEQAAAHEPERLRAVARECAEFTICRLVCRRLAFALARRDDWQPWEVEQGTLPTSLTLAADDYADQIPAARAMLAQRLGAAAEMSQAA